MNIGNNMDSQRVHAGKVKVIEEPLHTTDSSGTGNVPDPPKLNSTVNLSEEGKLLSNATYSSGTGNVPDPPMSER
ncbi:hypothetical protein [Pseudoalteromonas sp. ASV78]|uniref:hypothetical protein n=1 Tax=Pseudoalteromonas sp. ASV78 TaxID=3397851 RepID=UPI0039FD5F02